MTRPKNATPSLMDETERLLRGVVKDARLGRKTLDAATGKTRRVPLDILDRVRALDGALKFLQVKNKLEPEADENEFDKSLRDYHGQGGGNTDSAESANGGASTAH